MTVKILRKVILFTLRKDYLRIIFFLIAINWKTFLLSKFTSKQNLENNNWIIWSSYVITLSESYYKMIQHILPESISNNTETFTQILPHNILFVRVHITQYWHFWRVTTKYYYTHFSNFFSHNTFSGSFFLKKKTLWPLFVDGVQLPQG